MNLSQNKSLIILHFIIILWGFTGILGNLINISSEAIVLNRMFIAFLTLFILKVFIYNNETINQKSFVQYLLY